MYPLLIIACSKRYFVVALVRGSPYRIIFCHVRKRDKERFRAAMSELPGKMLLCGNADYLDVCNELMGKEGFL